MKRERPGPDGAAVWLGQEWGEWLRMRTRTDWTELRRPRRACGLSSKWNRKLGKGLGRGTEERCYSVYVLKPSLWPQGVWAKVNQTWKAERPFRGCSVSQGRRDCRLNRGKRAGEMETTRYFQISLHVAPPRSLGKNKIHKRKALRSFKGIGSFLFSKQSRQ